MLTCLAFGYFLNTVLYYFTAPHHEQNLTEHFVFLHPGLQKFPKPCPKSSCLYCGCECIIWYWCVHTYLSPRVLPVVIHSTDRAPWSVRVKSLSYVSSFHAL